MKAIVVVLILLGGCSMPDPNAMSQDKMENIVIKQVDLIMQKRGYLSFKYKQVNMMLISDAFHNRMRIIAPIIDYSNVTEKQKDFILQANFHQALDARYAVSDELLYSAYIHPLSPLNQQDLIDALNQVANLALSFGSTYSSGTLSFAGDLSMAKQPKL